MTVIQLTQLGTYETGIFDESAAEIPAYDPESQSVFVVNGDSNAIDILDIINPTNPVKIGEIDLTSFGDGVNSVAVKNGIVAVAVEAENGTEPGQAVFFDTDGNFLNNITVGVLPDMITFSPDGSKVLTANEGEPTDEGNPDGSVSIIDLSNGVENLTVANAEFTPFNGQEDNLRTEGVRIFPDTSVSADVEPEYIDITADGTTAYVSLQENNAVAVIDIATATVTDIQPLGLKDWSQASNKLDASDQDDAINIRNWPVFGMYMPDSLGVYEVNGETYYVTANEGDARSEDERIKNLTLDPTAFPNAAELQADENLGRLEVSTIDGDTDGDGDFDQLLTYGGRSFSIFDSDGNLVFDSGSDFAEITAAEFPDNFNSDNDENTFDSRSDAKGSEPEGIEIGEVDGKTYAFVGLERIGGIMVYDITTPETAEFVQYLNNRDFSGDPEAGTAGDLGPEGLEFVNAADSPTGHPLLIVSNEVSGSTSIYDFGVNAIVDDSAKVVGTNKDDLIRVTGNSVIVQGKLGDDVIFGSDGNDILIGDRSRDPDGNDIIFGSDGDDILRGKAGDDRLFGEAGNDIIRGDDGDDILRGGLGDDKLEGDKSSSDQGSDTFILAVGEGTDTIVDFEDGIDLIGLAEGLSFSDLSLEQQRRNTLINFGDETLAVLKRVDIMNVTEDDFVLV